MSADIKTIKALRDRTNLGMNDCKRALEESNNDIEAAIDVLKKWGELKGAAKSNRIATEGRIATFASKDNKMVGMLELSCETDFLSKSQEFYDLLHSFSQLDSFQDAAKFEEKRFNLVAKTGENIVLRRHDIWHNTKPNSVIRSYVHPGDRLGVLVEVAADGFSKDVVEFADELAMQIAAMNPSVVRKEELPVDETHRQHAIFEAQLTEEGKPMISWQKIIEGKFGKWHKDVVLLEQASIKENKKSINQLRIELEKKLGFSVEILRFVRYELGEHVQKPANHGLISSGCTLS